MGTVSLRDHQQGSAALPQVGLLIMVSMPEQFLLLRLGQI
jgi:hypothetical protein